MVGVVDRFLAADLMDDHVGQAAYVKGAIPAAK